jgi:hypothetical protein
MTIYAHYQDDGPSGICPQSMDYTCHWSLLFIFDTYDEYKEAMESIIYTSSRVNPRITGMWDTEEQCYMSRPTIVDNRKEIKKGDPKVSQND